MFERQELRRLAYPFSRCIENVSSRQVLDWYYKVRMILLSF
jgi:hypothetical protein